MLGYGIFSGQSDTSRSRKMQIWTHWNGFQYGQVVNGNVVGMPGHRESIPFLITSLVTLAALIPQMLSCCIHNGQETFIFNSDFSSAQSLHPQSCPLQSQMAFTAEWSVWVVSHEWSGLVHCKHVKVPDVAFELWFISHTAPHCCVLRALRALPQPDTKRKKKWKTDPC